MGKNRTVVPKGTKLIADTALPPAEPEARVGTASLAAGNELGYLPVQGYDFRLSQGLGDRFRPQPRSGNR